MAGCIVWDKPSEREGFVCGSCNRPFENVCVYVCVCLCRPTKVHRFYVKNTVEEKVFQLLTNQSDRFTSKKESESVLTIRDIKNLFTE